MYSYMQLFVSYLNVSGTYVDKTVASAQHAIYIVHSVMNTGYVKRRSNDSSHDYLFHICQ